MNKTKIDWCDTVLNSVVGCSNGCPFCYAKKLNDRFHFIKNWNEPQFFPERLESLKSKKPRAIFMDSMSDYGLWEIDWLKAVDKAMMENPHHAYIFLTKTNKKGTNLKPKNVFFGKSITKGNFPGRKEYFDFLSIEPLHAPVGIVFDLLPNLKQVIIGAETGNRKGKIKPKKEWVESIVKQCDKHNVRVFMKESLRELMGSDFRQDQCIWYDVLEENQNERKETIN